MILRTRADALGGLWCGVVTPEITRTSRLVSRMTGYAVQPNKAIVGRNAFAHEAGIHQHGMLSNPLTYEIMDVASVGLTQSEIVLGKHSGPPRPAQRAGGAGLRAGPRRAGPGLHPVQGGRRPQGAHLGGRPGGDHARRDARRGRPGEGSVWRSLHFCGGTGDEPRARVAVRDPTGSVHEAEAVGDGPVDALMKAIDAAVGQLGRAARVPGLGGHERQGRAGRGARGVRDRRAARTPGQSVSTDVLEASAIAYVRAVNASRHAEHGERVAAGGV